MGEAYGSHGEREREREIERGGEKLIKRSVGKPEGDVRELGVDGLIVLKLIIIIVISSSL